MINGLNFRAVNNLPTSLGRSPEIEDEEVPLFTSRAAAPEDPPEEGQIVEIMEENVPLRSEPCLESYGRAQLNFRTSRFH